jgi:hypothetical protein
MSESGKDFPDWETLYKTQRVETMPWYNENFDPDLDKELNARKITYGKFLDLGTGPATQALWLAKRALRLCVPIYQKLRSTEQKNVLSSLYGGIHVQIRMERVLS